MLSGNRGEWSEYYAFLLCILADGKIISADADLNALPDNSYIPIVRAIRQEKSAPQLNIIIRAPSIVVKNDEGALLDI